MDITHVNDVDLEYEIIGSGEPVLFISPVLADGFVPILRHPALAAHQRIHYHRRGWVGSTRNPGPVSIRQHADDAIALLAELGISRAHLAGHSSGAVVAAQVALTQPEVVHTLTLLELSLLTLPLGQEFLAGAGPVFEIYERGDHEGAFAAFMATVSGLDWDTCHELLESSAPGVTAQSIKDADTFFGVELPSLGAWELTPDDAGSITQPVLSVLGARTLPLWVEVAEYLRAAVPDLTELMIDRAGHLLHAQQPDSVAEGIAQFLDRHQMVRC